jgi:hypothetical protein
MVGFARSIFQSYLGIETAGQNPCGANLHACFVHEKADYRRSLVVRLVSTREDD